MLTKLEAPQNYKRLINKEKEKKDVIQIIDDEGFLREVSFDDLTSHPTTLAGYGITDAYISNGTIYLGNQSITPASVSSLGTAAYKDYTTFVTQGGTDLPTSDAVFQAIGAAVSSALHYRGISSTVITDGGTETAVIGGQPLVVQSGDVVIYSGFEFLWENNVWNKLGDDTSFALKTVQITGDGIYITGGGDLTTSRSLDLSQAAKDALTLASTALQSVAFSDLTSHPTTISGYGITDAKIVNGVITLGSNTITPLTSFTESDPVFSASAAYGITSNDILAWNAKYNKPSGGIPKSDLATSVQTSLEKADTALQSESDPTVPAWAKNSSLAASDVPTLAISKISGLQDALDGKQPLDADLTAIAALTGSGLLRRSSNNTWNLDTNTYLTSSNHKALTLKVGTITIGSDFNSLVAKTYTITKANLTDTIGDTTYAPYNADGYLPLSAGSSKPLTDDLYFTKTIYGADVQVGRIGSVIDGGIVTYFTNPSSGSGSGTGPGFAIINTPYERLLFWRGSTDDSLEIYHEGNLTKGVLTTLLESNNGYYVKKSGDTMTGTLNSQSIIPTGNASYDLGSSASKWNNIYTRALYAAVAKISDLLSIPTVAPASGSIVSGEAYLYSSTGSYAETPGGGVADVYPLTITKNGSAWLYYNPGTQAETINLVIPTKVSDLTNDTGFITASSIPSTYAWSAITNTPTTLSGYGITDAKIETPSGTSNRKITLGSNNFTIYSWALASAKPSYTLDEIADGSTRKLANYLPLTGNAVASKITGNVILGNNVFLQGVHTNGTDVRELIGLDNNNIVTVGCSTNQIRLITSSVDIKHNKNGTLYSVYDESNLTKSVLTGLLDANNGYYLPLTGGYISNSVNNNPLRIKTTLANTNGVYLPFYVNTTKKTEVGYWSGYGAYLANTAGTTQHTLKVKDDGTLGFDSETVWHSGNDGASSGLDADLLDGKHASDILTGIEALKVTTESDATFTYRAVPSVAVGDVARATKVKGKTIVWNQLVPTNWFATNTPANVSWTNNGDGSYTINGTASGVGQVIAFTPRKSFGDHKYYLATSESTIAIYFNGTSANQGTYTDSRQIVTAQASDTYYPCIRFQSGATFSNKKVYIKIIDLTLMFGKGSEPTSVAEFEALYPEVFYSYNAGELVSNKAESIETIGFNLWDEEWILDNGRIFSKNYCPCIGGATYYLKCADYTTRYYLNISWYDANFEFISSEYRAGQTATAPNNARWFKINTQSANYSYGTTYNHDICINLSDPSRNGEYKPYKHSTLSTPITEIVPADKPTVRLNQLVQNGDFSQGTSGWFGQSGTISSSDGELAITPTVNNGGASQYAGTLYTTHKYYVSFTVRASAASSMMVYNGGNSLGISVSIPNTEKMRVANIQSGRGGNYIWFRGASTSCTYYLSDVTLIDLTEMYGAGNEPTSTAEVEELIGSGYIPYNTGEGIPNHIFPKGMKSAGSVSDEWSGRTATKRIGVVDLGTLTWQTLTYRNVTVMVSQIVSGAHTPNDLNMMCSKYEVTNDMWTLNTLRDKIINNNYSGNTIYAYDSAYTNAATFKAAMSGVLLYYELATPIEYDLETAVPELIECDVLGTQRRLPEDTASSVQAPFRCDFQYGANPGEIVSDSAYRYLPLAGGTVTGTLEAKGELVIPDHAPYEPEPNKHYLYVNDNGNYYQS